MYLLYGKFFEFDHCDDWSWKLKILVVKLRDSESFCFAF